MLNLEERRVRRHLIIAYKCMMGKSNENCTTLVPSERRKGDGLEWKTRKFQSSIRKILNLV